MPSGRKTKFKLYLPADFDRHQQRRYPLIMSNGFLDQFAGAFANCNVIYATGDGTQTENWADYYWELYQYLAGASFVDANRVFLGGDSAETHAISQFLLAHPNSWKGVILSNPSELPDLRALALGQQAPKLQISAGSREIQAERFNKYLQDASKVGIRVDVGIQEGANHFYISQKSNRERFENMKNFIFND